MSTLEEKIYVNLETWLAALDSSACIGCTSLVPWLFNMTFFERHQQLEGKCEKVAKQRAIPQTILCVLKLTICQLA